MARILIADDSALIRGCLRALLSAHKDWVICGEANNGRQAVTMANQLKPDLIILDIAMPIADGLRAASEILTSASAIPIIIYTLYENEYVDREAKAVGARKVVSKMADSQVLIHCAEELLSESPPPAPLFLLDPQSSADHKLQSETTAPKIEPDQPALDVPPDPGPV